MILKKKLNCILLVEDNHLTNLLNKKLLERWDAVENVHIATNGEEGLQYLLREGKFEGDPERFPRPNIIFLDINMPIMNGWEFLEAYENLSEEVRGNVLIVMLTTSPNPDDELKASDFVKVADYKRKPLSEELFREVIANHFPEYC